MSLTFQWTRGTRFGATRIEARDARLGATTRSPLRLQCVPSRILRRKMCRWTCAAPFAVALFRRRPGAYGPDTIIIHRSAKTLGQWQETWIDDRVGPTGDSQHGTCDEAVRQVFPRSHRLVQILDANGKAVVPRGPLP